MEYPKFIVDAMCGRLAKWLRFLGYNTLYYKKGNDKQLLKLAIQEGRILITKDTEFIKHKKLHKIIFIKANNTEDQFLEVIKWIITNGFNPPKVHLFPTRCIVCNGEIKKVCKKHIVGLVPDYIFETKTNFHKCNKCHRIYWEGSHTARLKNKLNSLLS